MRDRTSVSIADVRRLRYHGLVADSLKPLATEMGRELGDLLADKGDAVTAAERLILEDVARVGLLLRSLFAVYLETQDPEIASKVSSLAGQRRASLVAVGLERRARPITVAGVLAEIEAERSAPSA